jgi:hypothetical protein
MTALVLATVPLWLWLGHAPQGKAQRHTAYCMVSPEPSPLGSPKIAKAPWGLAVRLSAQFDGKDWKQLRGAITPISNVQEQTLDLPFLRLMTRSRPKMKVKRRVTWTANGNGTFLDAKAKLVAIACDYELSVEQNLSLTVRLGAASVNWQIGHEWSMQGHLSVFMADKGRVFAGFDCPLPNDYGFFKPRGETSNYFTVQPLNHDLLGLRARIGIGWTTDGKMDEKSQPLFARE